MGIALVGRFAQAVGSLWNKPALKLGPSVALAGAVVAGPTALAVVDHELKGALSYAALKTAVDIVRNKVKEGATAEEVETTLNAIGYISDVSKTFRKGAQNAYVEQRMQQKDGIDAIYTGKRAAVEFQLLPDNVASLGAKYFVRTAIADELHKGDRNAADKYIASTLIDDIVKGAQVIPLEGNQVSRDDVKTALVDVINNPAKHPVASRFFEGQDRLMNGLRQVWPELAAPSVASAKMEEERKKDKSLSDMFGMSADGDASMMKIFAFFIAMMMQMLGLGKKDEPESEVKKTAPISAGLRL